MPALWVWCSVHLLQITGEVSSLLIIWYRGLICRLPQLTQAEWVKIGAANLQHGSTVAHVTHVTSIDFRGVFTLKEIIGRIYRFYFFFFINPAFSTI